MSEIQWAIVGLRVFAVKEAQATFPLPDLISKRNINARLSR
jgi:hypothetical protein